MANRIFVALDTPDLDRARTLAQQVRHHVGGIKLGLEFFCAHGPSGIRAIEEIGLPVFLDLKLHDIPNTVAKAVQSLAGLAPAVLTVHASGGRAMSSLEMTVIDCGVSISGVSLLVPPLASDRGFWPVTTTSS